MTCLAHRKTAKNRLNVGRKGFHVRHHDHHIAGLKLRIRIEPGQEAVMQHLDFALGRMSGHQSDRVIIGRRPGLWRLWHGLQVQNRGLHLGQLRRRGLINARVHKCIHARQALPVTFNVIEITQEMQVVTTLFTPRRQQRLGCGGVICRVH